MVFYFSMVLLYFVMFVSFRGLSSNDQLQSDDLYSPWFRRKDELDLNLSYFHRLEGYHVDANLVKDPTTYPWIAKVIHSRKNTAPYLCTASCVDTFIFITSARCVYLLKIKFTSLIYQNQRLTVKALVRPSKESQQLYDDIAFIIVDDEPVNFEWAIVKVYEERRPDDAFLWFENKELDKLDYVVVGYARDKKSSAYPVWQSNYELTDLHVIMNMRLCSNILPFAKGTAAFNVLCYHSCSLDEFDRKDVSCLKYHGVDGGAVLSVETNTVMGVATWGSFYHEFELPVGVAMTNTDTFRDDFNCAKRIRDHKEKQVALGFYQSLCDKLKPKVK